MKNALSYADAVMPAHVRYADISATEKLMFAEISANLDIYGYAVITDEEFAQALKIRVRRVGALLDRLADAGFIGINCDGSFFITKNNTQE